jgi:hypothetical protein
LCDEFLRSPGFTKIGAAMSKLFSRNKVSPLLLRNEWLQTRFFSIFLSHQGCRLPVQRARIHLSWLQLKFVNHG